MKLERIKSEKQLPIGSKLVKAELSFVDGEQRRFTLWFDNDLVVELGPSSYSACSISVSAAPVLEERHLISATLEGHTVSKAFKRSSDADAYLKKLQGLEENGASVTLKRSMVKMAEDEPEVFSAGADEIPF
jgi:hypothetical protein